MNLEQFVSAYIACALWSSVDENCEPLDLYSPDDIDPQTLEVMRSDCKDFIESNADLLKGLDPEQCGHDFWLTRNRHGAGFWDRGLGDVGQQLTEACRPYGEFNLYEAEGVIHGQ